MTPTVKIVITKIECHACHMKHHRLIGVPIEVPEDCIFFSTKANGRNIGDVRYQDRNIHGVEWEYHDNYESYDLEA